MTSVESTHPEIDVETLLTRIDEGSVPREFVLSAARGMLPLDQDSLVTVVTHLTAHEDEEVHRAAKESLREFPARVVVSFARSQTAKPGDLDRLSVELSEEPEVLEAILRNRQTSDETIARLAAIVPGNLQEVIVINQERILRTPSILDMLLENPAISADVRRRAVETREEFFEKRPRRDLPTGDFDLAEPEKEEDAAALEELLLEAEKFDASGETVPPLPPPADASDEKKLSVWAQVALMTVSQKVQLAFKGGTTERSILVRERNRLVCGAVVRNPRVTENEIEMFAGMRNLDDEVLRIIGNNRQWMQKYPIMSALIRNPKAPIGIVLPLINRLNLRDLKALGTDKGVSETVRSSARRLYLQRRQN